MSISENAGIVTNPQYKTVLQKMGSLLIQTIPSISQVIINQKIMVWSQLFPYESWSKGTMDPKAQNAKGV